MVLNETTNFFFNETNYQYLKSDFENLEEKNNKIFQDFHKISDINSEYYKNLNLDCQKSKIFEKLNHSFDDDIALSLHLFKKKISVAN